MDIQIIWGNIIRERTDVLVTLASSKPKVGSGVDKAVHMAAGDGLLKERLSKIRKMGPGLAVFTKPYGLAKTCRAKNVVHISSVPWEGGERSEDILLDAGYLKACVLAVALEGKIVTFPVMGAGVYDMPKKRALDCAVKSLKECSRYFPDLQIKLVTNEGEIFKYAMSKYRKNCLAHYSSEQEAEDRKLLPPPERGLKIDFADSPFIGDDELEFWKGVKIRQLAKEGTFASIFTQLWNAKQAHDKRLFQELKRACIGRTALERSIELTRKLEDNARLLLSKEDLVAVSGVSFRTLKRILGDHKNQDRKCEKRDSVLALCAALSLPKATMDLLLRKWGSKFGADEVDAWVARFIRAGGYALEDLNPALKHIGMRELNPAGSEFPRPDACMAKKGECR